MIRSSIVSLSDYVIISCSMYKLIAFCILDHLYAFFFLHDRYTLTSPPFAFTILPLSLARALFKKVYRLSSSFTINKNWFIADISRKPSGITNLYAKDLFNQLAASIGRSRDLPKQEYTSKYL